MATQTEAPSTTPSVQVVGNAFVEQYYHILHHSPNMVHKFYQDASFISRPDEDGTMITVTTMKGINDKICSLDYTAYKAEIKTADAQESYKDGVIVLVTGSLTRKEDDQRRKFIQSFFLAPQDKGYFVLNDVFRYVDESKPMEDNYVVVEGIDDKQTPPLIADPPRTIDSPSPDLASVHKEETQNVEEEAQDVTENEGLLANENNSVEPEPYPSENNMSSVAESISSIAVEDAPKMSYASILSSQTKKGGPGPTKVYVPTLRTAPAKTENISVATVAQGPPPEVPAPIASSSISSPDSSNVHNEGDGHSIYIRNLPLNATVSQLEMEFKKFGPIKQGGIQVRSNKLGFCFGFVEFQDFSSMQNAIQSSPVVIGGREAVVEIKRTTTRVGTGRGSRFPAGRGGFRNEGFRGRGGSFNGGRGYGRSDYGGGRGDFSGRGRGPGGRGDGYHQQGRGRGGRRGGSAQYTSTTA
ncbi:ras GTPase-activating protein-binding protein 1-like isoform X2 [Cynara cardunculus var. scolymus]|uniref:ras GTPase-activating protein-binding protein 1-like isoform X2 n=1 Tax=Cynara cardunculus var. scolymus TaxID=59895 RepID=UPI000D62887B|nr:ras GTPase-activating protein-binding protein 1-like isoform X2 [Cynara cardunculus var. scolymus]